ncbi:ribosomal protein L4/L1 family protein [Xylariaceae sp. FL0594]|nr:ribosomal protein L4/L1 family protein [Xylariaceae sp. FL0594]
MATKGMRGLNEALKGLSLASHTCREAPSIRIPSKISTRSMATETTLPSTPSPNLWRPATTVPVTIFDFPSYEPRRLESWSAKHLNLPLRRDLLHLAVVYEGDNTRQGTASSKTRWEVHGSHKKLRPQKGLGRARVGDKQSPIRVGGGKAHGPKPRDFGTHMTRKAYDMAWRTALSYRYRRGELVVCQDGMELPLPAEFDALLRNTELRQHAELEAEFRAKWAKQVLDANDWGRRAGRSTFITTSRRDDLFDCLDLVPNWGRALDVEDVDVKDLLETGRLVVEREALMHMLESHQSDLVPKVHFVDAAFPRKPVSGDVLVE